MSFWRASECIVCEYGDGLAILDRKSNNYFSIDAVGISIWKRLNEDPAEGCSMDEIVAAITDEFEVSREVCVSDIRSFLHELERARLVECLG